MKLSLSDTNGDPDGFVEGTEENKEYPINAWIPAGDGKQVYMLSAYVYDKFIMFLYMYDLSYHPEHKERYVFKVPETFRESLEQSKKFKRQFRFSVQYKMNDLNTGFSSRICMPRRAGENVPAEQQEFDKYIEMCHEEYTYLCNLMKEAGRVPEALKDKEPVFGKDILSFDGRTDEINSLAICPHEYESIEHDAETTFTVPYGEVDVCVPYILSDTGEESYFIVKELKLINMADIFEKRYEEMRKIQETALENTEINNNPVDLDEIRRMHNVTILTMSIQQPVKDRSFQFYTNEYLDSKIKMYTTGSSMALYYFFQEEKGDSADTTLYNKTYSLGEADGEPKNEYEITLVSITDSMKNENKALIELRFNEHEEE